MHNYTPGLDYKADGNSTKKVQIGYELNKGHLLNLATTLYRVNLLVQVMASSSQCKRRSFTVTFKLKAVEVAEKKTKEAGKVNRSCDEFY